MTIPTSSVRSLNWNQRRRGLNGSALVWPIKIAIIGETAMWWLFQQLPQLSGESLGENAVLDRTTVKCLASLENAVVIYGSAMLVWPSTGAFKQHCSRTEEFIQKTFQDRSIGNYCHQTVYTPDSSTNLV